MPRKPLSEVEPGDIIEYDYRNFVQLQKQNSYSSSSSFPYEEQQQLLPATFRLVQWNIERGIALEKIIAALETCEADIIVLQELDISCCRSHYMNVPKCIAKALSAQIMFVCEFIELDDLERNEVNAVGPLSSYGTTMKSTLFAMNTAIGVTSSLPPKLQSLHTQNKLRHLHGNAIVSRFATLTEPLVIRHCAGVNWNVVGLSVHEPRIGCRCTLRVTVNALAEETRNVNINHRNSEINTSVNSEDDNIAEESSNTEKHIAGKLYIYNCHFEIFCGMLSRVRQLGEVMNNAQQLLKEYNTKITNDSCNERVAPAIIIAGDFNTIAHGIVRFSRYCASDRMSWLSCGETEACWWQRKVLSRHMHRFIWTLHNSWNNKQECQESSKNTYSCTRQRFCIANLAKTILHNMCVLYDYICNSKFVWRYVYGFRAEEIDSLNNTLLCLYDAMDKYDTVTLNNRDYHNFVQGKLDWVLMSHCTVICPFNITPCNSCENGAKRHKAALLSECAELRKCNKSVLCNEHTLCNGYVLFNNDYSASDHKGILVGVKYCTSSARDCLHIAECQSQASMYTSSLVAKSCFVLSRIALVTLLVTGATIACKTLFAST